VALTHASLNLEAVPCVSNGNESNVGGTRGARRGIDSPAVCILREMKSIVSRHSNLIALISETTIARRAYTNLYILSSCFLRERHYLVIIDASRRRGIKTSKH